MKVRVAYTVRITPAVAADYEVRDLADCYVGDHNAYAKIDGPGTYTFTEGEVRELMEDARYYSEAGGPGDYLTVGQRSAYRRLAAAAAKGLAAAQEPYRDARGEPVAVGEPLITQGERRRKSTEF